LLDKEPAFHPTNISVRLGQDDGTMMGIDGDAAVSVRSGLGFRL
jgi:hypothetical protein